MVQKLSYTANSITLGTGTSKVVLGADSGNLIVKDSQANTSILEPGLGVQGASAVTTYANPAALPFSPISSAGSLAYTTSTGALYMSNGSGWYKITLVNTAPSITLSSTTASPTATNLTLDFTYTVAEPEGTPVTVTLANSGIATTGNVAVTHTTSNTHVRLVFDGTTKYSGDASVTLTVTDGVNTGTGTITITTAYYAGTNTRFNSLIMKATGTGNNDTYDDASTSNHTVNKNGTVEQLSYSPYRDNGYSVFFDGTGDYLNIAGSSSLYTALDLGTADYTVEFWMYPKLTGNAFAFGFSDSSGTDSSVAFALRLNLSGSDMTVRFQNANDSGTLNLSLQHIGNYNYKWSHVAVTRTGGNQNMYINGLLVATQSDASAHMRTPAHSFSVGRAGDRSAFYYKGYLTDLRIVAGTAVYTGNFTPPTTTLTAVSNTKLLVASNGFRDGSTSNHTITASGDTKMEAFSPYDRQDRYTIATGGGSAYFNNGDSDYLEIPASADHQIYGGNYTVEAWLYPTAFNSENAVFLSKGTASAREYHFSIHSSNFQVYWSTDGGSSGSTTRNFSTSNNLNEWIHVAITKSSNTITVYKNGVSLGTGTFTSIHSTNNVTTVGRLWQYTGINHQFRGYISNLRIVKGSVVYSGNFTPPTSPVTAITNTKLLLNSTDSKIFDASQSAKRLTIGGDAIASSTQQHFSENTLYIEDGDSDFVEISEEQTKKLTIYDDDYTVETWLYPTNFNATYNYFISKGVSPNSREWAFSISASDIRVYWSTNGSSSGDTVIAGTVSNSLNQWVNLTFTKIGNNVSIYKNGTHINSGTFNSIYSGDDKLTMGRLWQYTGIAHSYDGYIHDLRVSKGIARYPYYINPVTLTTTNSGMTKPDTSTPTATASNVTLLTCHTGTAGDTTITDGSSNSTSITVNGNAVVSNFGPGPGMKSVYFDGTGDYLQCTLADTLGTADWTIEYWVWHNSISGNQIHCAFNGYAPAFYRRNSSNAFAVYHNGGISSPYYNANITPVVNRWYHMAYVHDDSENKLTIFIDGALADEFTYSGNINGTTFRIGDDGTSAWMNGYISNLRIVKNTALYTKNFTPSTEALQ